MQPDWQTVHRLLLACSFDQATATAQLKPAIQQLDQKLPATKKLLLTSEATHYRWFELSPAKPFDLGYSLERNATISKSQPLDLISSIGNFDAVILFTQPHQSPYSLAYFCYLIGIPIRIGCSSEFGGGVLSTWIKPPIEPVSAVDYHLHLLKSANLVPESILSISQG